MLKFDKKMHSPRIDILESWHAFFVADKNACGTLVGHTKLMKTSKMHIDILKTRVSQYKPM